MNDFFEPMWKSLRDLIDADDGEGISARADELQDSGVLAWHHPEDELQRTPLMLAYWFGHLVAASALARAGADYHSRDTKGRNVTWYAQNFGKGQIEGLMSMRIKTTVTRISMESVIREKNGLPTKGNSPKPRRRSSGV